MSDKIICRCEEVLLSEIVEAMKTGAQTEKELKLKTRAGMGICQGRTCRPLLEQIISFYTNKKIPQASNLTFSIPVRPLSLSALAHTGKDYKNEN
ncbi:hypothetical protein CIL03_05235 [Virgibacillus indicus]|uniref:BFD-like [2Fe-2S]-binding domain-containing protein n=1 Tax=Virgibacillus indicus TaxID=2024554 RepID=A0A265NER9_9BACI|nr:(2Fe-2S)-binding protein [Virgibacillus indicus]OZU90550.1 hypothetical protein CIL03_05235 [Virgibacillus indicus]